MRGVLITFEGVEGSGKSTQARRLVKWLESRAVPTTFSREPGGTAIGERIRMLLLDPAVQGMDARTELFLYLASRSQHVRELVMPALSQGRVVVLDRYLDSSVAYQGAGRDLGVRLVARLNKLAAAATRPQLTFLFDLPVALGQQRQADKALDRLEQERVQFHERVRAGYLQLARRAAGRFRILDGTQPADELESRVRQHVCELLNRKGILRK